MSAAAATSRTDRLFLADAKANVNCIGSRLRDIVEDVPRYECMRIQRQRRYRRKIEKSKTNIIHEENQAATILQNDPFDEKFKSFLH